MSTLSCTTVSKHDIMLQTLSQQLTLWRAAPHNTQVEDRTSVETRVLQCYNTAAESLNLCGSKLTSLFPDILPMLSHLKILNLSQNALTQLPERAFFECPQLEEIYLNDNIIKHIPAGTFTFCTNLRIINLANNVLSQISRDAFPAISTVKIYLSGNCFLQHPMLNDIECPEDHSEQALFEHLHPKYQLTYLAAQASSILFSNEDRCFLQSYEGGLTFPTAISLIRGKIYQFHQQIRLNPEQNLELQQLLYQLNLSVKFCPELTPQRIAEATQRLSSAIAQLELQDNLLLYGAFMNIDHATTCKLQRIEEDKFCLFIYDTSYDSDTAPTEIYTKARYFPNLTRAIVTSTAFLNAFSPLRYQLRNQTLFEYLASQLDLRPEISDNPKDIYPTQQIGTCAISSIRAYWQCNLSRDLFSRLNRFLIEDALQYRSQLEIIWLGDNVFKADTQRVSHLLWNLLDRTKAATDIR